MFRYWELLTDVTPQEIEAMRRQEPMPVKLALARRIVSDFHSAGEAHAAEEAFTREVREGGIPDDVETVDLPGDARAPEGVRVVKMLVGVGLAGSRTDAERKLKAGAVEINGARHTELLLPGAGELTVRVGKKWKKVRI
jgi:tyrosyl-tRNA synthetase